MSSSVSKDGQAAASSAIARDFLTFINASPSQFHAVATAAEMLTEAGFRRLRERDDWSDDLQAGGAYFYTRNQSSLVAFVLPDSYRPARDAAAEEAKSSPSSVGSPFFILAAHTDSPVLKVKPVSKVAKHGCLQVGVECYGGGLWHTWSAAETQTRAPPRLRGRARCVHRASAQAGVCSSFSCISHPLPLPFLRRVSAVPSGSTET